MSLLDQTKEHEVNSVENFMLKYGYIIYGDDGKDGAKHDPVLFLHGPPDRQNVTEMYLA